MSMPEDTADYTVKPIEHDYDRTGLLLHIVNSTRDYPKLKSLHDAATVELQVHADDVKKKMAERQIEVDKLQAEKAAKEAELAAKAEAERTAAEDKTVQEQKAPQKPAPVDHTAETEPNLRRDF